MSGRHVVGALFCVCRSGFLQDRADGLRAVTMVDEERGGRSACGWCIAEQTKKLDVELEGDDNNGQENVHVHADATTGKASSFILLSSPAGRWALGPCNGPIDAKGSAKHGKTGSVTLLWWYHCYDSSF